MSGPWASPGLACRPACEAGQGEALPSQVGQIPSESLRGVWPSGPQVSGKCLSWPGQRKSVQVQPIFCDPLPPGRPLGSLFQYSWLSLHGFSTMVSGSLLRGQEESGRPDFGPDFSALHLCNPQGLCVLICMNRIITIMVTTQEGLGRSRRCNIGGMFDPVSGTRNTSSG